MDESEIGHGQIVISLISCDSGRSGPSVTDAIGILNIWDTIEHLEGISPCSSSVRKAGGMARYFNIVSLLPCHPSVGNSVKIALSFKTKSA